MRCLRWLRLQMRDPWLLFHSAADWTQAGVPYHIASSYLICCSLFSGPLPASFTARSAWFALFPFPSTPPRISWFHIFHTEAQFTHGWDPDLHLGSKRKLWGHGLEGVSWVVECHCSSCLSLCRDRPPQHCPYPLPFTITPETAGILQVNATEACS